MASRIPHFSVRAANFAAYIDVDSVRMEGSYSVGLILSAEFLS